MRSSSKDLFRTKQSSLLSYHVVSFHLTPLFPWLYKQSRLALWMANVFDVCHLYFNDICYNPSATQCSSFLAIPMKTFLMWSRTHGCGVSWGGFPCYLHHLVLLERLCLSIFGQIVGCLASSAKMAYSQEGFQSGHFSRSN